MVSTSGVAGGYAGATKGKSKLATMLMLRPLSTVEEAVLVPDVLYSSVFIDRVNLLSGRYLQKTRKKQGIKGII